MTPEEKALRDAFLSEMWPTCPEWKGYRESPPADRRMPCDTCGRRFPVAELARHLRTAHRLPEGS